MDSFIILGTKIAFHLNIFSVFYLKLPLEELTKENNDEKFHGLLLFLSHVLGSASHIGLYRLIPDKKTSDCRIRP